MSQPCCGTTIEISMAEAIKEASILFDGTEERENPEYLRGMAELIAYCFDCGCSTPTDNVEDIKAQILKGAK